MAVLSRPSLEVTLHCLDPNDPIPKRCFVLSPSSSMLVGRASKNPQKSIMATSSNTYIDSPVVSRNHAIFTLKEDSGLGLGPAVYIADRGSMHGTKINSQELKEINHQYKLRNGDVLVFGGEVQRDTELFTPKSFKFMAQKVCNQDDLFPRGVSAPSEVSEDEFLAHGSSSSSGPEHDSASPRHDRDSSFSPAPPSIPASLGLSDVNPPFGQSVFGYQNLTVDGKDTHMEQPRRTGMEWSTVALHNLQALAELQASKAPDSPHRHPQSVDDGVSTCSGAVEEEKPTHSSWSSHDEVDSLDGYDSGESDIVFDLEGDDDLDNINDPVSEVKERQMQRSEPAYNEACCEQAFTDFDDESMEEIKDPENLEQLEEEEEHDELDNQTNHEDENDGNENEQENNSEDDLEIDSIRRHKLANMLSHHEQHWAGQPKNAVSPTDTASHSTAAVPNTYATPELPSHNSFRTLNSSHNMRTMTVEETPPTKPQSDGMGRFEPPTARHEVPSHHWNAGSSLPPKLPTINWDYTHYDGPFMWAPHQQSAFPTKSFEGRMFNPHIPAAFPENPTDPALEYAVYRPPSPPPAVAPENATWPLGRDAPSPPAQLPRKGLSIKEMVEHEPDTTVAPVNSPPPSLKRKLDDFLDSDEENEEEALRYITKPISSEKVESAKKPEPEPVKEVTAKADAEPVTNEALSGKVTLLPQPTTACDTVAQRPRKRLRHALNLAGSVATGFAIGAIAMVGGLTALPDNFFQ